MERLGLYEMLYGYQFQMVTCPMTSRDPKGQSRDPDIFGAKYLENA